MDQHSITNDDIFIILITLIIYSYSIFSTVYPMYKKYFALVKYFSKSTLLVKVFLFTQRSLLLFTKSKAKFAKSSKEIVSK